MDNRDNGRSHSSTSHTPKAPGSHTPQPKRPAPSPAELRRGRALSITSALLGIVAIVCVMVHFFLSPLNAKIILSNGYNGKFFGFVPVVLGCVAIVMAVLSRKSLPPGKDSFSIVGSISGIIAIVFGSIQVFTCTICTHFNLFGINLG